MRYKDKFKLNRVYENQKTIQSVNKELKKYKLKKGNGKKTFRAYIYLVQMFMRLRFQA